MRKLLFGSVALAALAFSSCNTDPKDSTQTITINSYCLVTPVSGGVSQPASSEYTLELNVTQGTASIMGKVGYDGISFMADGAKMGGGSYNVGNQNSKTEPFFRVGETTFNDMTAPAVSSLMSISNFKGMIYEQYVQLPDLMQQIYTGQYALISYQVNNQYNVKPLQSGPLFFGPTRTTYTTKDGVEGSFDTKSVYYQIVLTDPDKTSGKFKLNIYNAKFYAEQAKTFQQIVIDGLKVEWLEGSYRLTGENIVPTVIEGNTSKPNPDYTVDEITITVTGDNLQNGAISFKVADRFSAQFSGVMTQKYQNTGFGS